MLLAAGPCICVLMLILIGVNTPGFVPSVTPSATSSVAPSATSSVAPSATSSAPPSDSTG